MDERPSHSDEPRRGARLLLVAVPQKVMAKGGNFRARSAAARDQARLRRGRSSAAGRPEWPRLPYPAAELFLSRLARRPLGDHRRTAGAASCSGGHTRLTCTCWTMAELNG